MKQRQRRNPLIGKGIGMLVSFHGRRNEIAQAPDRRRVRGG
jgi:hypothetical protein